MIKFYSIKEILGVLRHTTAEAAPDAAALSAENRELKGRLAVCELQLFNVTTVAQSLLEQKDAEIERLTEAVRYLSPYQEGPGLPGARTKGAS